MNQQNISIGTVTGTGAAIDVELGFVPDYVKIINIDDGDVSFEFFSATMTDGHAIQRNATGDGSRITSNGISQYAGASGSAAKGFTIGSTISENTKVLSYIAMRGLNA